MSFDPRVLFENFIGALSDGEAGGRLYEMHAPDALLCSPGGLKRAEETDREEFAAAHRDINLRSREGLPQFLQVEPLRRAPLPAGGTGVYWFEVMERWRQEKVWVAVGIREHEGCPQIGWATVTGQIQEWSYEYGYLHSLADYPWMRVSERVQARALIDASYLRQFWRPPLTFRTLPDARFTCQMSTVCCKHDFEISLPAEAQLLIDAIPWKTVRPELDGSRLPVRADGTLQLKTQNESCRFLGPVGQCLIHTTLGRQPFGACCVFPVAFAQTPEGIDVALSPICDGTRRGIGPLIGQREEDLRERLIHATPRRPNGFRLAPALQIPWEEFRAIEQGLCDILRAELPLRRRLYLGCRLLGSLQEGEPIDTAQWLTEPPVVVTTELRQAIHQMLARILGWDRTVLRDLPQEIPADLFEQEIRDAPVLAGILQNTLFCKTYSYPYDLTTAHNFLIVLYLLALLMQASTPAPLTDAMWRELGSLGVHGLLKSVLHEGVPAGFRDLFGTAQFGIWMLRA